MFSPSQCLGECGNTFCDLITQILGGFHAFFAGSPKIVTHIALDALLAIVRALSFVAAGSPSSTRAFI